MPSDYPSIDRLERPSHLQKAFALVPTVCLSFPVCKSVITVTSVSYAHLNAGAEDRGPLAWVLRAGHTRELLYMQHENVVKCWRRTAWTGYYYFAASYFS